MEYSLKAKSYSKEPDEKQKYQDSLIFKQNNSCITDEQCGISYAHYDVATRKNNKMAFSDKLNIIRKQRRNHRNWASVKQLRQKNKM